MIRSNAIRKQIISGIAFCAIFITGISVKDDATNKLTPIGGVTKPIARFTTIITPKMNGFIPIAVTIGNKNWCQK